MITLRDRVTDQAIETISDVRLQVSIDGNADRIDTNCFAMSAQQRLVTQQ